MIPVYLTLAALSCLSFALAEPLHISLVRRRGPLSIENRAFAARSLRGGSITKRQNTAAIPLVDQGHDLSYMCAIRIGTPPQSFNVYIATGASDLWVAGSACTTCNQDTTGFIEASSSTLETVHKPGGEQIRVTLSYSIGIVAGDLVRDTVGMGDFLVPHQEWILVDQSPAGLLEGSAIGIMGLAFDTIAGTEATPFWQLLAQSGLLATPEMSFWLARHLGDQNAQDEDFGGIFTLGGQNQTLYTGDVEFFPLVVNAASGKKTLWLLNISGITVNGKDVTLPSGGIAAIDIGETLVGGPSAAISAIYAQIPNSQPLGGDYARYYGFPCDATVEVTMAFGGRSWPIDPRDINLGQISTGSSTCVGAFFDAQVSNQTTNGQFWLLGTAFLKNVYLVLRFQPPAIGFAELSASASGSSGTPGGGDGSNGDDGNSSGDDSNSSNGDNSTAGDNSTVGGNTNAGAGGAATPLTPSVIVLTIAVYLFACSY